VVIGCVLICDFCSVSALVRGLQREALEEFIVRTLVCHATCENGR
jgi:hypothetical protein